MSYRVVRTVKTCQTCQGGNKHREKTLKNICPGTVILEKKDAGKRD